MSPCECWPCCQTLLQIRAGQHPIENMQARMGHGASSQSRDCKRLRQRLKHTLSVLALLPDFLAALSCFSNFSAALFTSLRFCSYISSNCSARQCEAL